MKYTRILLLAVTFCHPCLPRVKSLNVDKIQSYIVSSDLQEILDAHSDELTTLVEGIHATRHKKHGVWQFDWLPGYYVKYDVSRVAKREIVAECIETYNLDLLHTPKKQLYHLQGRPKELHNRNYVVIIEELEDHPTSEPMSLEQVKQFIRLIETSGHCSTFSHNYVRLEDGRISFIDTDGTFNAKNPIRGIIWLLNESLATYYSQEAGAYILDKIGYHYAKLSRQDKNYYQEEIEEFLEDQQPRIKKLLRKSIQHYKGELS